LIRAVFISAFASNYLPSKPAAKLERGNLVKGRNRDFTPKQVVVFLPFSAGSGWLASSHGWLSNLSLADRTLLVAITKTKRKRLSI
jgi:hypothetical protein